MIDNEFVFELDLKFNRQEMIRCSKFVSAENSLMPHQRSVEDFDYFLKIQKEIPILGSVWNVYDFRPGFLLDVHVDSARTSTLNIPLLGGEDSVTKFYENSITESVYVEKQRLHQIKNDVTEKFNFTLVRPSIIRTDVPHSIKVGKSHRLIISWGLVCDFDDAKKYFKNRLNTIKWE
jgi:hypothetical protein